MEGVNLNLYGTQRNFTYKTVNFDVCSELLSSRAWRWERMSSICKWGKTEQGYSYEPKTNMRRVLKACVRYFLSNFCFFMKW